VSRVVVDPIAKAKTHLVVEPTHRQGLGPLFPFDPVEFLDGEVQIRCAHAEFDKLDAAEETGFLPSANGYGAYRGYARNTTGTLPLGEVAVRRGEPVHARRDRGGPGSRHRSGKQSCHSRAPAGGTTLGSD